MRAGTSQSWNLNVSLSFTESAGGVEGGDGAEGAVGAVQVPGEEAGEVLDGAEDFVAADWGG